MARAGREEIFARGWDACIAYADDSAADHDAQRRRRTLARMLCTTEEKLMNEEAKDALPEWNPNLFMPPTKENA